MSTIVGKKAISITSFATANLHSSGRLLDPCPHSLLPCPLEWLVTACWGSRLPLSHWFFYQVSRSRTCRHLLVIDSSLAPWPSPWADLFSLSNSISILEASPQLQDPITSPKYSWAQYTTFLFLGWVHPSRWPPLFLRLSVFEEIKSSGCSRKFLDQCIQAFSIYGHWMASATRRRGILPSAIAPSTLSGAGRFLFSNQGCTRSHSERQWAVSSN